MYQYFKKLLKEPLGLLAFRHTRAIGKDLTFGYGAPKETDQTEDTSGTRRNASESLSISSSAISLTGGRADSIHALEVCIMRLPG